VELERVFDLPPDLQRLRAPAAAEGFEFLERVAREWAQGTNRFERPGEALFAAREDGLLLGVCGLNVDPYASDAAIGRLRNLYVHPDARGRGVGRALVERALAQARDRFRRVRLRSSTAAAARLYVSLGFAATPDDTCATHALACQRTD
jgi:GNAT superfamily N-acetyltransferase